MDMDNSSSEVLVIPFILLKSLFRSLSVVTHHLVTPYILRESL